MDLTERPATLDGIDGVLGGSADDGLVWRAELPAAAAAAFLGRTAGGATLELHSDSGVCHADVRRCWVDVGDQGMTVHVALQTRPVA